jgi:hypothetical protein
MSTSFTVGTPATVETPCLFEVCIEGSDEGDEAAEVDVGGGGHGGVRDISSVLGGVVGVDNECAEQTEDWRSRDLSWPLHRIGDAHGEDGVEELDGLGIWLLLVVKVGGK